MVYVTSDLHGYPHDKFLQLLESAHFSNGDFLYIIGDVIDINGDGGVKTLCWLLDQPNVQLLLGNHEAMLLSCDFVFNADYRPETATKEQSDKLYRYRLHGGDTTLSALQTLPQNTKEYILEYLQEAPLYELITVKNRDFLLVHAGLDHFRKERKLSEYSQDELLLARPSPTDHYFDDVITIVGHTTTFAYGEKYRGKIIKARTWVNIDVGAAYGQEPVLLRLDDFKQFRISGK